MQHVSLREHFCEGGVSVWERQEVIQKATANVVHGKSQE